MVDNTSYPTMIEQLRELYESFPDNFWVCGHIRKVQLENFLDKMGEILGYVDSSPTTMKEKEKC